MKEKAKVKYVIFDKDNTITAPYEDPFFSAEVRNSVNECHEVFGRDNVAMLSNSVGGWYDRVNEMFSPNKTMKLKKRSFHRWSKRSLKAM